MKNDLFVFIGDSLTFGYGVNKTNNWVYKLQKSLSLNLINKGINGNTTTDMLNRFSEDVIIKNPKSTFIMGGTNDLLSNRSTEFILKNIELMITECLSINSKIILGIPPTIIVDDAFKLFSPCDTYNYCINELPKLRDGILLLAKKYNLLYFDFYSLSLDNISNNIFLDGIHFNETGQDLLFTYADKLLSKSIH
ncbi:MAG: GDSL-type esterase/lipase family protein [Clostridium sp.]